MGNRLRELLERALAPVRELLGRMSQSQRISLAVLGLVVFLGISALVFSVPGAEKLVPFVNLQAHPEVLALVEEQGIPHEVDDSSWLRVAPSSLRELRRMGVQELLDNPEEDLFQWLFDQPGWQETAGRRRDRMLRTRVVDLERTLAATRNIKSAKIHLNKPPSDDWTFRSSRHQATASVVLIPADGTPGLSSQQALVVAKAVSGAFAIPQSQVQVTDGTKSFDLSDPSALFEGDRYNREKVIEEKIRSLYSNYTQAELRVSVNLVVNTEAKSTREITFDQDRSFTLPENRMIEKRRTAHPRGEDPGTGRNVRSDLNRGTASLANAGYEDTYEKEEERLTPALSRTETDTRFPAYQERAVNILVKFSRPAIIERLRIRSPGDGEEATKPSEADLRGFLDKEKRNIEGLFVAAGSGQVTVDDFTPAPSPFVDMEPERGVATFLAEHIRELLLAVLALVGCFLIYRMAFAAVPEIEELPDPVADLSRFLAEREQELERRKDSAAAQEQEDRNKWEVSAADQQSMDLLDTVTGFVQDKPEATAAVMRLWMSGSDKRSGDQP